MFFLIISFHSQKQRKAALRKERRKRKRQALAQTRECGTSTALVVILNFCIFSNSLTKHINYVSGLNNGEICTPEDDEPNDQDDVRNDTYELQKYVAALRLCTSTFTCRPHRNLYYEMV